MLLPYELATRYAIPALRAIVAKRLIKQYGKTQMQVAKLLGITQSAVSNYVREKRGDCRDLQLRLETIKAIREKVDEITSLLVQKRLSLEKILLEFTEACNIALQKRMLCGIHKMCEPAINVPECQACNITIMPESSSFLSPVQVSR